MGNRTLTNKVGIQVANQLDIDSALGSRQELLWIQILFNKFVTTHLRESLALSRKRV